jgi:hypothetical protein
MSGLHLVTILLAAVLAVLGLAKVAAVPRMRLAAVHHGLSVGAYRAIGTLELAASVGLVIGIRLPALGVAAAVGVTLLMLGGVTAHVRSGDPTARWLPAIGTASLAVAYAVLVYGEAA